MNYDIYKFQQPDDSYFAEKEKEQCARCLEPFEDKELFTLTTKPHSPLVCSFCLNELNQ